MASPVLLCFVVMRCAVIAWQQVLLRNDTGCAGRVHWAATAHTQQQPYCVPSPLAEPQAGLLTHHAEHSESVVHGPESQQSLPTAAPHKRRQHIAALPQQSAGQRETMHSIRWP